jgi:hypothetical protein
MPLAAHADIYESAFFAAQFNAASGSLTNVGIGTPDSISGEFVFDVNDVPLVNTGVETVPFSEFPDIASIPPSIAFRLTLGTVSVDLSELVLNGGAIVYNNGQFAGFDAQFDFTVGGQQYLFQETGTLWNIQSVENGLPTGDIVASGTIDIGPNSMFGILPVFLSGLLRPGSVSLLDGPGGSDSPGGSNSLPSGFNSPPGNGFQPPGGSPSSVPEPRMFWVLLPALGALVIGRSRATVKSACQKAGAMRDYRGL